MADSPSLPLGHSDSDLDTAANRLAGWLLEAVADDERTHQALCDLSPTVWIEAAEVAIRAARGERDCRPFTTTPGLPLDPGQEIPAHA